MIVLIFLGIFWLKYNTGTREGNASAGDLKLANGAVDVMNDYITTAIPGLDVSNFTDKVPGFIDQVLEMVSKEAILAGQEGASGQGPPDLSTVVDTTGSDYYTGASFFTGKKFSDGFCQAYKDPYERNNKCGTLTTENCNQTDCCVVLNGSKCVAGDAKGPAQTTVNGKDIDYTYYSYKNECYGSCGKGSGNAANPCSEYTETDKGVSEACIKRLWGQTKCSNPLYVNSDLVNTLKDYSKAAIQVQFKEAEKDEPNFEKCYGPNEAAWPVPCNGTTDSSYGLSKRCMTKLFTNQGCTYRSTIDDDYVAANSTKPKSALINTFGGWANAPNNKDGYLTKCYGPDEFEWPDPCENVADNAKLYNDEIPQRCYEQIWKNTTQCPSTDYITSLYNKIDTMSPTQKNNDTTTKKSLTDLFMNNKNQIQNKRFQCYGVDPNKWPDDLGAKQSDLCGTLTPATSVSDVPQTCRNRLLASDIFPTENCSPTNLSKLNTNLRNPFQNKSFNGLGTYSDNLMNTLMYVDSNYNSSYSTLCMPKVEHLLGIGSGDNLYTKPTSDFNEPWTYIDTGGGDFCHTIQLQDGTYLACGFYEGHLYKKKSLKLQDPWVFIPRSNHVRNIMELPDASIVGVGPQGNLYITDDIDNVSWRRYTKNDDMMRGITLLKDKKTILGVGTDHKLYINRTPGETGKKKLPWIQVNPDVRLLAVTQLKDGTFVGVDMNGKTCTAPEYSSPPSQYWKPVDNGWVYAISTVYIESDVPQPQPVINESTKLCLDIVQDGRNNKLIMNPCDYASTTGQQWIKIPSNNVEGTFNIKNYYSGLDKCLDSDTSTTNGLIMKDCDNTSTTQSWTLSKYQDSAFKKINNSSGKSIDILNDDENTLVLNDTTDSREGQIWMI
jgi:hypothetical protein